MSLCTRRFEGWDANWRHVAHQLMFFALLAAMVGWFVGRTIYNDVMYHRSLEEQTVER